MTNSIQEKSFRFAVRIVKLCRYLQTEKKEYVLSKQIVRSGTSIGANVREALQAQTRKEFASKMNIALKEASETEYWLELLHENEFINDKFFDSIYEDCQELIKLLVAITKTQKEDC